MKKPGIPAVTITDTATQQVVAAIKENLEIITGARPQVGEIKPLAGSIATTDLINKINEVINRINYSGQDASPVSTAELTDILDAITSATGALGTMSTQDSDNVDITGGSVTGITDLAVADGGTGASSITANSVILGNGSNALSGNLVAPGTSGNALISNGTTWASAVIPDPTTTQVLNATAGASAGAVGTYAFAATINDGTRTAFGNTLAGSVLETQGVVLITNSTSSYAVGGSTTFLTGTWMCMGTKPGRENLSSLNTLRNITLWLRIS